MNISVIQKAITSPHKALQKAQKLVLHSAEDTYRKTCQRSRWSTITNEHEIRMVGMRRTGNHAVFEWIKGQTHGQIKSLNNLEVNVNPYRYKYEHLRDFYPEHEGVIRKLQPFAKGEFVTLDWLFYSYEDHDLDKIFSSFFERNHDLYVGKTQKRFDVLILRDPFNLFASRLKSNMVPVKNSLKTATDLWIEYAREFLGETHYLTHNPIRINYNEWFQSRDYRAELAQQLDIPFTDAGIDTVNGCGGGSSFEGRQYVGNAQAMPVLQRWQKYREDPLYRQIFRGDRRLQHYSEKIFGVVPGTDVLFDTP